MHFFVLFGRMTSLLYALFCLLLILDSWALPAKHQRERILGNRQEYTSSRSRYVRSRPVPTDTKKLFTEHYTYQVPRFSSFAWWQADSVDLRISPVFGLVKTSFVEVDGEVHELKMAGGTVFSNFAVVPFLLLLTSGLGLFFWHDEDLIDRFGFLNTLLFLSLLYFLTFN